MAIEHGCYGYGAFTGDISRLLPLRLARGFCLDSKRVPSIPDCDVRWLAGLKYVTMASFLSDWCAANDEVVANPVSKEANARSADVPDIDGPYLLV